jgi:hypothetical protein
MQNSKSVLNPDKEKIIILQEYTAIMSKKSSIHITLQQIITKLEFYCLLIA